MNLINNNPYRILGLPITASEREIAKQINTLTTYAEMGKTKSFDTDFAFMSVVDRKPQVIEDAKKQIEKSENKFLYSLFWFWQNNSIDELAVEVLKEGNTFKAIEIWEKSVFKNKNQKYKQVVFIENLIKESTEWYEGTIEQDSLTLKEDLYILDCVDENGYLIPVVYADINDDENWTIECDTEWHSGVDNNGYGVIIGRNGQNYFTFNIAATGYYRYGKGTESDEYEDIISWTKCKSIHKKSTNSIKIEKINEVLNFYINLEFIVSIQYQPLFGKKFGFKVESNQKISFRNFKFCKLVEDESYGEGINISSKNYSSLKNLSTLYLSLYTINGALQLEYFKRGIVLAKIFFTSKNFDEFSKLIAGERYIYNPEKVMHFYINEVMDSLKNYLEKPNGISTSQLIHTFSSFPTEAKQFLNNRFVSKQINDINKEIEIANYERKESDINAHEIGKKLISNTKTDIAYLKNVLGESDFQYQIIADKLSLAVVQCGIDHYNATKNDEDYLEEYYFAVNIAVTQRTIERAKENLDSCKEWIANKHLYNCWFCGIKPPDESSEYSIKIYKVNSRSNNYLSRNTVQYSSLSVNIPRCCECQKVHDQSSAKLVGALISCASFGLLFVLFDDGNWFAGLLVGGIIGWIIGAILERLQISKAKIKDIKQSTISNYPALNKMLREGWQFSEPTA